VDQKYF